MRQPADQLDQRFDASARCADDDDIVSRHSPTSLQSPCGALVTGVNRSSPRISVVPWSTEVLVDPASSPEVSSRFGLVTIAASAGGLTAVAAVLSALPKEFPLPIAVVQHIDPRHPSLMAEILARRTALRVKEAREGDRLANGVVYIAPPDRHLEIRRNDGYHVVLARSEPIHHLRPSADRLFESAAQACGPVIGIVLTGTGRDGAVGAQAIKRAGGYVIAQNEASSAFFGMPQAAIESGAVDVVLPLDEIASTLSTMTRTEPS